MSNRLPFLALLFACTLAASAEALSERAGGATPEAKFAAPYLTIAEARRAARREVYRIARKDHEEVRDLEIKWCRRRSRVRVGCRYTMWRPVEWRSEHCHGGVRVIERAGNRHYPRAWSECIGDTDG